MNVRIEWTISGNGINSVVAVMFSFRTRESHIAYLIIYDVFQIIIVCLIVAEESLFFDRRCVTVVL